MKLCQIYNFAPHYRTEIYVRIAQTFDTDFVFGKSVEDIKKANYELLDADVIETDIINKQITIEIKMNKISSNNISNPNNFNPIDNAIIVVKRGITYLYFLFKPLLSQCILTNS